MKTRKFEIIECPKCGYEYLPAEIYIPNAYFGKPSMIMRDNNGKITDYQGSSIDVFETYICDKCATEFKITSRIGFITEGILPDSFDEEYTINLHNGNLFLEEN